MPFKFIFKLIKMSRPQNALIPFVALLVGYSLGSGRSASYNNQFGVILVSLFSLSMFATLFNDLKDYSIDRINGRKEGLHGDSPLPKKYVIWGACSLLFISFISILYIANGLLLILYFLLVLMVFIYNGPILFASRRPIMSILVLSVTMVSIPMLMGFYLNHQSLSKSLVLLLIALTIGRASVAILKDYKDYKGDLESNKITFLVKFGNNLTKNSSIALGSIGYIVLILFIFYNSYNQTIFAIAVIILIMAVFNILIRLKLNEDLKNNSTLFLRIVKHNLFIEGMLLLWLYT